MIGDLTLQEVSTASDYCLRWRAGAHTWRHRRDGGFDSARYSIRPIPEPVAKDFIVAHHYSRSYPAAARRLGLYEAADGGSRLVGVAVFGIPVQASVLTAVLPTLEPYRESLELSRFVLLDEVPANAETWFLARAFTELLTVGVRGVVSFADPMPRHTTTGAVLAPGHIGTIYQASNALYTGRGTARTLTLLPDGTVLNARAMQKVRRQERGHEYVERRLMAAGARVPDTGTDMAAWLAAALDDIGVRRLRHRGPHRYVFRLGRNARARSTIPIGLPTSPYPKTIDHAAA
jgi:hypothetical protein